MFGWHIKPKNINITGIITEGTCPPVVIKELWKTGKVIGFKYVSRTIEVGRVLHS